MRISVTIFLLLLSNILTTQAQDVHWPGGQAVDVSVERSEAGYSIVGGYMKDISYNTFYRIKGSYETGKMYKLDYSNLEAEGSVYYNPFFISHFLQFNIGAGLTAGYDQIRGLPKETQQKVGLFMGLKGGAELEGFLSERLSCLVQAEQAYMIKQSLGKTRFQAGVGLRFYLNNYYWR